MTQNVYNQDRVHRRTPRTTGQCFSSRCESVFQMRPEVEAKISKRRKAGLCIACGKNPCECKRKRESMLKALPRFYLTDAEKMLDVVIHVTPAEYEARKAKYYEEQGAKDLQRHEARQIKILMDSGKYKTDKDLREAIRAHGIRVPRRTDFPS